MLLINMCTFGVFCCGFHFEMIRKHLHELIRPNTIRFKQQEYNSRNNKAQILCFFPQHKCDTLSDV